MKKSVLSIFTFLAIGASANAQNVNIPDANFKTALLAHNPTIDTDSDGEISVTEAVTFSGSMNMKSKNISDLTGIEAFTNITQLDCSINQLTSLNVSNNTALTSLLCYTNQLISLNVANGNNTNFTQFSASNNPNLICIQVDDVSIIGSDWYKDSGASWNEDCSGTTGINKVNQGNITTVYPNPTNSTLNIEVKETANIKIVNMLGATVAIQQLNAGYNSIDVNTLTKGIYLLQIDKGGAVKFIKE